MKCKIVRFKKLMWRNMMSSIKSQKVSVLHYNIDMDSLISCHIVGYRKRVKNQFVIKPCLSKYRLGLIYYSIN